MIMMYVAPDCAAKAYALFSAKGARHRGMIQRDNRNITSFLIGPAHSNTSPFWSCPRRAGKPFRSQHLGHGRFRERHPSSCRHHDPPRCVPQLRTPKRRGGWNCWGTNVKVAVNEWRRGSWAVHIARRSIVARGGLVV